MPRLILRGLSAVYIERFDRSAFHIDGSRLSDGEHVLAEFQRHVWKADGEFFSRMDAEDVGCVTIETARDPAVTFDNPSKVTVTGDTLWVDDRCVACLTDDRQHWLYRASGESVQSITLSDADC